MRCLQFALLAGFLLLALPGASAADRIALGRLIVDPQTAENAAAAGDLVENLRALSGRLFDGRIEITPETAGASYSLSIFGSFSADSPTTTITLTSTSDESRSASYSFLGPISSELPSILAHGVFLLWSSLRGTLDQGIREPPVYVDELASELVAANTFPMGLSVKPEGTLVVALAVACVEIDSTFGLISRIGSSLYDAGLYAYAYGVSSTPAGTLYLKPGLGRDVYKIVQGAREPQRVGLGLELSTASIAALPDGSLFYLDGVNRKAIRIQGRQRQELKVFTTQYSYINAAAAAPDGTLWLYDQIMRGIRIFTAEGTPVDSILPLVDPANPLTPYSLAVGPDGSFIVFSYGQLAKFRRDGSVAWRLTSLRGADQDTLPLSGALAVDWTRGLIYLSDTTSRRIVKLLDREYAREKGIRMDFEEKVVALRRQGGMEELGSLEAIAKLYESVHSTWMARYYWQKLQDADPANEAADERLLALDVEELQAAAGELDAKARATLAAIGLETARPLSVQAIQKYELVLSKAPGDEKTRKAMTDLRDLFTDKGASQERKKPLTVTVLKVANLFPSLMQWYAAHPPGSVTVKNTLTEPVQNLRAVFTLPRYMDLPTETRAVARLAPGESVTLPLAPVLNQGVLELQEDIGVQAQVTLAYTVGASDQAVSQSVNVTIYRNSALSWDDTRKISSFITPNDATVSGFAARVLASAARAAPLALSATIFQAMRIFDAVGAYGITYVQDPESPFSRVLGKAELVDTVRFPRTTLYNRTGDCDDTTALLCSLLESVGIRTAVLTSPGHIFMAFDSGEPAQNASYLSAPGLETITRGGNAWIPVETTVLSQGFMAAWTSASDLVRKYAKQGPFEIIPVTDMRDSYPALPLPASAITIAEPLPTSIDRAFAVSFARFTTTLYSTRLSKLEAGIASLSTRQAVKVRVQEGVLHALFGKMEEAESAFRAALKEDPTLVSAYVNLANVRILAGDSTGALAVVKLGLAKSGDSPLLNLLAARIFTDTGDTASAAAHFAVVRKAAPDLAERFAALAGAGADGAPKRAARAGAENPVVWGTDQ